MNGKIIQENKTIKIFIFIVFAVACMFVSNVKASALTNINSYETNFTYISETELNTMLTWYNNQSATFKSNNPDFLIVSNPQTWSVGTLPAFPYKARFYFYNNACRGITSRHVVISGSSVRANAGYGTYANSGGCVSGSYYVLNNSGVVSSYSTSNYAVLFTVTNDNTMIEKKIVYSTQDILFTNTTYQITKYYIQNGVGVSKTYVNNDAWYSTYVDEEPPVLDFAGIEQPQWLWKGDTYTVPMPTAYDNIDGDITSNITTLSTLNPNIVGNYQITYEVCDSSDNCTSYNMPVEVRETIKTIDMTGKSAILFWYKDFSKVLSPNAYCDSIEMTGSCFVQSFDYLGRWKYSKVNLSNLDVLLYENGGIYAPLDPASTNYKTYEHINIGHLTSGFEVGNEYGILMYNESGANIVKIKYNQKYFDYKIYNSLNDTDEKEIPYIDAGGNNQNTTDVQPPYTDLEDPATVNNPTTAGLFGSFTTNTYGLTAIISAPLNLINQLTSKGCTPVNLPLPYLNNKYLVLPCMSTIYETYFGSFFTLYQLITFGVVSYWVIVRLLNMIKDFKNPDHDEIEVLDL